MVIILIITSLNIYSQETHPYIHPTPGEIVIMASTPIPHGLPPTHEAYKDLIECGFNLGIEGGDIECYKQQFAAIGNLNFKYLISNPDLRTDKRIKYIEAFKDSKYLGGWCLRDEPSYSEFDSLKKQYDALYRADPDNLIYMNFLGGIIKGVTGPFTHYMDYLNYIGELFKPEMWSYDFYPFQIKNNKIEVDYDQFYQDLECMWKVAKIYQRPFWTYLQSMAYKSSMFYRPVTNETYLRFVVFSSLAYGAQGVGYWTYGQRKSHDSETYISALVNLNGKKTSAWYAAKKVNGEIKKFNDIFYNCEVKEVRHTGDRIYKGTRKLSGEFGPFKMIRSQEAGVMASLIENNGSQYVVIVNRDVFKNQKITLELKPNRNVVDLSSKKEREYNWRKDINITLEKGGYVIFNCNS